jgi:hypothetical protein
MATELAKITNIRLKLDVKNLRDAGGGTVSNATTGAAVTFNKSFKDIRSIVVTAARNDTDMPTGVYDFTDVPNPTGFTVFLYATKGANAGNRITGDFSWSAEGI